MKILGITGGIGAGKSMVTQIFEDLGATIIDADKIAAMVLEPDGAAFPQVVEAFGRGILTQNGEIHRRNLAKIVFHNKEKLELLNRLTHPRIYEEMERQIRQASGDLVCMDVPLLFTSDSPISCDATLAVLAPYALRMERVMQRDGATREEVEARMKNQLSDAEMERRADFVILNDTDANTLRRKVEEIYQKVMGR